MLDVRRRQIGIADVGNLAAIVRVLVLRPEGQRRSLRFVDTPINVAAAIMLGCGDSRSVFHRCICERPR